MTAIELTSGRVANDCATDGVHVWLLLRKAGPRQETHLYESTDGVEWTYKSRPMKSTKQPTLEHIDGTLWCAAVEDPGGSKMWVKRGDNNGATWQITKTFTGGNGWNDPKITHHDGELWLFVVENETAIRAFRSADGVAWTNAGMVVTAPHRCEDLDAISYGGRLLLTWEAEWYDQGRADLMQAVFDGSAWFESTLIADGNDNEGGHYVADGEGLRIVWPTAAVGDSYDENVICEMRSLDGGDTWTPPQIVWDSWSNVEAIGEWFDGQLLLISTKHYDPNESSAYLQTVVDKGPTLLSDAGWTQERGLAYQHTDGLCVHGTPYLGHRAFTHRPASDDYDKTFRLRSPSENVRVCVRYHDANDHYLVVVSSQAYLYKRVGGSYTKLAESPHSYSGEWIDLRVTLSGPQITVGIDGQQKISFSDSTFFTGGIAISAPPTGRTYCASITEGE